MHRLVTLLAIVALSLTASVNLNRGIVKEDSSDALAEFVQMLLVLSATEATDYKWQKARYDAWLMLCFELREDANCSGLKAPKVMLFKPNPLRPGLMGQFRGGDIIYLRNNLTSQQRLEVLAHEMSHYLDDKHGYLPEMPVYEDETEKVFLICYSEKRAWAVSDEFNRKFGSRSQIVGKDWVNWYKHCQPFKDRLYEATQH